MPIRKRMPASRSPASAVKELKPFDIAALATALSIYRSLRTRSHLEVATPKTEPKDCIEEAYDILTAARKVLEREFVADERERAEAERKKAEGVYESNKTYSWSEVLVVQREVEPKDPSAADNARAKFFTRKKWKRLAPKIESGEFRFTDTNLVNRPPGFSMVGGLTTQKGLRNAIKRLFPEHSAEVIASKVLELWRINEILVDQLRRNKGVIPKPRAKSTAAR